MNTISHRAQRAPGLITPQTAFFSLSDMAGAERLLPDLVATCPQIRLYATDGTAARLNKILDRGSHQPRPHTKRVTPLSAYTTTPPETQDIVKTLDTRVFLGVLADRTNANHQRAVTAQQVIPFDMIIVNFYERKIDIGGPALLRAAAKNARQVVAIGRPRQYDTLLTELRQHNGATGYAFRRACALTAMRNVASYVRKSSRLIPREHHG